MGFMGIVAKMVIRDEGREGEMGCEREKGRESGRKMTMFSSVAMQRIHSTAEEELSPLCDEGGE
jgi:hypothetical protein